jgi:hypothetical protein
MGGAGLDHRIACRHPASRARRREESKCPFERCSRRIPRRASAISMRSFAVSSRAATAPLPVPAAPTLTSARAMYRISSAAFASASIALTSAMPPAASWPARPHPTSAWFAQRLKAAWWHAAPVVRSASATPSITSTAASAPRCVAAASRHARTCSRRSAESNAVLQQARPRHPVRPLGSTSTREDVHAAAPVGNVARPLLHRMGSGSSNAALSCRRAGHREMSAARPRPQQRTTTRHHPPR